MPSSLWSSYKHIDKMLSLADVFDKTKTSSSSQMVTDVMNAVGYPILTYGIMPLVGWLLMLIFCIPVCCIASHCLPYQSHSRAKKKARQYARRIIQRQHQSIPPGSDPLMHTALHGNREM